MEMSNNFSVQYSTSEGDSGTCMNYILTEQSFMWCCFSIALSTLYKQTITPMQSRPKCTSRLLWRGISIFSTIPQVSSVRRSDCLGISSHTVITLFQTLCRCCVNGKWVGKGTVFLKMEFKAIPHSPC